MASVFDVAQYILHQTGSTTTWKLHKLVYYSQAWALVWDDEPLFSEKIEAWANGPVSPDLYHRHAGRFKIERLPIGRAAALTKSQRETVDAVVDHYGKYDAQRLSRLTHAERPWKDARKGLDPGERGSRVITEDSMAEYYGGL